MGPGGAGAARTHAIRRAGARRCALAPRRATAEIVASYLRLCTGMRSVLLGGSRMLALLTTRAYAGRRDRIASLAASPGTVYRLVTLRCLLRCPSVRAAGAARLPGAGRWRSAASRLRGRARRRKADGTFVRRATAKVVERRREPGVHVRQSRAGPGKREELFHGPLPACNVGFVSNLRCVHRDRVRPRHRRKKEREQFATKKGPRAGGAAAVAARPGGSMNGFFATKTQQESGGLLSDWQAYQRDGDVEAQTGGSAQSQGAWRARYRSRAHA